MKIKFDFLKSDEKDRLKLKKIDSKDVLYKVKRWNNYVL